MLGDEDIFVLIAYSYPEMRRGMEINTMVYVIVPCDCAEEFEHNFPVLRSEGDFVHDRTDMAGAVQFEIYINDWHARKEQMMFLVTFGRALPSMARNTYRFWFGPVGKFERVAVHA